jgi:hypothetical protein
MPKVKRTPPPTHWVVVDTNILWDKDKKLPVNQAFDAFWKQNSTLVPMALYLPEVVLGELHFQQATSALKALSTINESFTELSGIADSPYSHKCNEATLKVQVKGKLDRWLKTHGGQVLPTPSGQIDWASLIESAIWRKPPFTFDPKDAKNEKGFRDALILETVTHTCAGLKDNNILIFVCNDYLLRTTAEARLKSSSKFLAFESLTDFGSYINLTQQQFTNAFVKSIQNHARAKFYAKGDQTTIYFKHELSKRILNEHSAVLELKDSSHGAISLLAQAIGTTAPEVKLLRQMFLIGSTQFSALVNDRTFHWTSHIDVVRLYEQQQQEGLIASTMPPRSRIQVVGFDVAWRANVKSDGRFHDIEVGELRPKDTQVLEATEENLRRWRIATQA